MPGRIWTANKKVSNLQRLQRRSMLRLCYNTSWNYCLSNWFSTDPDGLPGNDDTGTLSTWLMCAMMGIYPVIPGDPIYTISTPKFKKITIQLDERYYPKGELIIETDKDPSKYKHLKDCNYFITHKELVNEGVLKLKK